MTRYQTPAQRLNAAHRQIDKLTDEVATLSRVLAAQNQAIVSIQREWRMWSDALLRMYVSRGDRRLEVARHRLDLIADNDCWRTFPAPLVRSDRVDYLRRLAVMVTTRRVSPGASCCL